MEKATTTVWVRNEGIVTIPKRIRDKLGIEVGDQVKLTIEKFPPPDPEPKNVTPA